MHNGSEYEIKTIFLIIFIKIIEKNYLLEIE